MDTINKKYEIEIEVLTPVSIGAGAEKDWVEGVDFLIADGQIYKLNLQKMLALQQANNPTDGIGRMTAYIAMHDSRRLKNLLGDNLDKVSDQIIPLPTKTDNSIKTCIKNELSNRPIMPGSSLKGAIRSHIYNYLEVKDKKESDVFGSMKTGEDFMRFLKIGDAEFEQAEFVNTKIFNLKESQGHWIGGWKHGKKQTLPNFQPTEFNTLYEALMPHAKGCASIMLSHKAYQAICQRNKQMAESKKRELLDIEKLFKIINENTAKYIKKEHAFFETYATHDEPCSNIMESLEKLLQEVGSCSQENTSCILKMAAGSGFHAITGDWQFADFTKEPLGRGRKENKGANPKSRKVALYKDRDGKHLAALMGFVKLRILSQEEIKQIETARKEMAEQKRREQMGTSIRSQLARAKALIDRQDPEPESAQELIDLLASTYPELLQEEPLASEYRNTAEQISGVRLQQQQEQARMAQYRSLLDEFAQAAENGDAELAEEKYQQAYGLVPEGKELASLKETLDGLKYEKLIQAAEAAYETRDFSSALEKCEKAGNLFPLRSEHKDLLIKVNTAQKASKGLRILEEKNEKGEYKTRDLKLIKAKTNDFLKKANLTRIPDDQIPILEATLKRVYAQLKPRDKKDWDDMGGLWTRDIMPWVGEEKMKGMFKKIIQNQQ